MEERGGARRVRRDRAGEQVAHPFETGRAPGVPEEACAPSGPGPGRARPGLQNGLGFWGRTGLSTWRRCGKIALAWVPSVPSHSFLPRLPRHSSFIALLTRRAQEI